MPSSPQQRRRRYIFLALTLITLTILYITTGSSSTRTSPFYMRSLKLMESRRADLHGRTGLVGGMGSGAEKLAEKAANVLKENQAGAGTGLGIGEEDGSGNEKAAGLKQRLAKAEADAKKNADDKWREANDDGSLVEDRAQQVPAPAKPRQPPRQQQKPVDAAAAMNAIAAKKAGAAVQHHDADDDDEEESSHHEPRLATLADATAEYARLLPLSPILIFSKSYCPYSSKAKRVLLQQMSITPAPHVIELDLLDRSTDVEVNGEKVRGLGAALQGFLRERTGRGTVPNVVVGGESIGGGDDVEGLWREGRLKGVVEEKGGREIKDVKVVVSPPEVE